MWWSEFFNKHTVKFIPAIVLTSILLNSLFWCLISYWNGSQLVDFSLEKLSILFSMNLTVFALVQAYSSFTQSVQMDKKEFSDHLRNELGLAYGPLYGMIIKNRQIQEYTDDPFFSDYSLEDKLNLDRIFATMPYMFPETLYTKWQEIQNMESRTYAKGDEYVDRYKLPDDFTNIIIDEYHKRLKKYREEFVYKL